MPSLAVMSSGHAQSQVTQFKKMEVLLRKVHFGSEHLVLPDTYEMMMMMMMMMMTIMIRASKKYCGKL